MARAFLVSVALLLGVALANSASAYTAYYYTGGDPGDDWSLSSYGSGELLSNTLHMRDGLIRYIVSDNPFDNQTFASIFGDGPDHATVDGHTPVFLWHYTDWGFEHSLFFRARRWRGCGTPIPEPSAALLFCLGFGVVGTATRKHQMH